MSTINFNNPNPIIIIIIITKQTFPFKLLIPIQSKLFLPTNHELKKSWRQIPIHSTNPSLIEKENNKSSHFYFLAKTHFSIGDTQQFLAIYFNLKVKLASLGIAMLYLRFFHAGFFFGFHCFFAEFLRGFCNINFLI